MTVHGKSDLFAHFVKIELLISLECAIDDELIGAFDAAIRRSVAKLSAAMRAPLTNHCFELDAFIFYND